MPADAEAFEFFAALGQKSAAGVWLPAPAASDLKINYIPLRAKTGFATTNQLIKDGRKAAIRVIAGMRMRAAADEKKMRPVDLSTHAEINQAPGRVIRARRAKITTSAGCTFNHFGAILINQRASSNQATHSPQNCKCALKFNTAPPPG